MLKSNPNYYFDQVCIPHSINLDYDFDQEYKANEEDPVIMNGPNKLDAYIKYREDRF